jgi:hypothetical protein
MRGSSERLVTLDGLLGDLRLAQQLIGADPQQQVWRGPARIAFDLAREELTNSLQTALEALERERHRAMLTLNADHPL